MNEYTISEHHDLAAEEDEPVAPRNANDIPENYRLEPVHLNINSMEDVPSQQFVRTQIAQLQEELLNGEPEAQTPIQEGVTGVVCFLCSENIVTRVCVPCGHWAGCDKCTAKLVNTPMYFDSINQNGEAQEEEDYRLPVRCPQCKCVVGKCMRVFF